MNWNNLTLQQFQDIYALSRDTSLDELERTARAISIIYDKSESQVDDMTLNEFNKLGTEAAEMLKMENIPGKPVKSFRVGAKRYGINYKPQTMTHRQYVEILTFGEKPIANMHLIMASIVQPMRFGIRFKNKSDDHVKVAEDMLNAPFLAVYHSCVFFCKLYSALIKHIRGYLIEQMMTKGMTQAQAENLVTISINVMDGYFQQSKSPILKV